MKNEKKKKTKNQGSKYKVGFGISVTVGLAMGLYACAYDPVWNEETASPTVNKANFGSEFGAVVEELPQPNAYQVRLGWPHEDSVDHYTLAREDLKSGETAQLMTLPPDTTEYIDKSVKPGISYRYHLGSQRNDGFAERKIEAPVPIDFVVSGAQIVNEVGPEFNRLWILENSTILTQGNDLKIEVAKIVAGDNAAIDTAPPGAWAAPNTAGKSGGSVDMRARTATGRLKIFATGQGGGQGTAGAAGGPGGKGPKGAPGTTRREYSDVCERHCPSHTVCDRAPGGGGQGGQGIAGGRGGTGLPGGDSAKVLVVVDAPHDFEVIPTVSVGPGGVGGVGGSGGEGGPGGDPGDCPSVCPNAGPGPVGSRGANGEVGAQGSYGNKQPVCMKLGASLVGDCSGFAEMTR